MKHTHPLTVIIYGVVGIAIGFVLEVGLVAGGLPALVPPYTITITLLAAAAIVVLLAVPIRRAIRGTSKTRINPFQAMRIVLLAKASSLVGSLIAGFGIGVIAFILTRPIVADPGSLLPSIATAAAGAVLLTAGLVAERLCTLPPDDPETK
jgi:hypothetical protein